MRINARWEDAARRLTLSLAPGGRLLPPARRPISVRLAGSKTTRSVVFEGTPWWWGFRDQRKAKKDRVAFYDYVKSDPGPIFARIDHYGSIARFRARRPALRRCL
jgi:hypothetical protein